jgi:VanZ family protein
MPGSSHSDTTRTSRVVSDAPGMTGRDAGMGTIAMSTGVSLAMTKRYAMAWCWTALILVLCWLPKAWLPISEEQGPRGAPPLNLDKAVHFALFAGFSILWARAVSRPGLGGPTVVFVAGLAVAAISEAGQEWSYIGRDATVADGLADVLGVVSGLAIFALLPKPVRTPSVGTT